MTLNSILTFLEVAPDCADRIHIGCLDEECRSYFRATVPKAHLIDFEAMPDWRGFTLVDTQGDYGRFKTARFRDVSFARFFALQRLMEAEAAPVMYADGDIGFLRDPRGPCATALAEPGVTMVAQSDLKFLPEMRFDTSGRPVPPDGGTQTHCTGFMVWTDPARAIELARDVIASRDATDDRDHDQRALNRLPEDRRADIGTLPGWAFPNGSYLFDRRTGLKLGKAEARTRLKRTCLVHANWLVGVETKIDALRQVGLWRLDDPGAQWTLNWSRRKRMRRAMRRGLRAPLSALGIRR